MLKYIGQRGGPLAFAALVALGACSVEKPKQDTTLAADSALNRDLQLAGRDTTAQPQLRDVPTTRPSATTPAPAPEPAPRVARARTRHPSSGNATTGSTSTTTQTTTTTASGNTVTRNPAAGTSAAGGGAVGTIPAGTTLTLASSTRVCTNTNSVGDKITATVTDPVTGTNGATIPAGATVTLTATQLKHSNNSNDRIVMEFAVNSISYGGHTYALDANMQSAQVDRVRNEPRAKDAEKVAIGAVGGAILGHILGKSNKGTIIGGAAGAAAGAAAASATATYEGCVPSGGTIVVRLNSATQVRV